ncbi:hypothetical protein LC612_23125 [Nostoc sp. CHAB 5834]|nr:hypothetical protein [Nostoc sp. CHAB 5834]
MESIGTLEPDAESPVLLEDSLSSAMLALFNNRVLYGVTVASAAPERSGAGGMSKMSAIADDVPGSSLKSVKVKVSGSYQSYPDLLEYLKELQKLPVAVVHVKVTAQNFDISIRVFGTLKS